MERLASETAKVAKTILAAPAWARLGIVNPKETLRQRAAEELAKAVLDLEGYELPDPDQLPLAL